MGFEFYLTGIAAIIILLAYAGLVRYFYSGWKRLRHQIPAQGPSPGPFVSVIIAARNEEDNILLILKDLAEQDYPAGLFEVILIDDGSTDETHQRVRTFISHHPDHHYKLIKTEAGQNAGSKKRALQAGVESAAGSIILTTDADCRVSPGWILAMTKPFSPEGIHMAAGPVSYEGYRTWAGKFQALEFLGLVASGAGAAGAGQPFLCNGACLAYRKKAFEEVGGYRDNERYFSGDDVFLMHKFKRRFGKSSVCFVPEPAALVKTRPVEGCWAFLRQRARWASKSTGYRDWMAVLTAVLVFSLSAAMVALFTAVCFNPLYILLFTALVILKSMADFPLLRQFTRFTGDTGLLPWLLPFETIYPFYVVIAAILGLFRKKKW